MSNQSILSEYVYISKYARFLHDEGRREKWHETIKRYFDFFKVHLKDTCGYDLDDGTRNYLENAIYTNRVMPSMRCLMTAGPALGKSEIAGYNCFSRETEFVTWDGMRSFGDFEDGDHTIILSEGSFRTATVRLFGKESLLKLTVKKGKRVKEIFTTANHRWITLDGSSRKEKTTNQLLQGDILKRAPRTIISEQNKMSVCKIGIMHGLVYGDGSKEGRGSTRIVLCDEKLQFKDIFFTGAQHELEPDRYIVTSLPWYWKSLPSGDLNKNYLMGFLMGWFAADGSVGPTGSNITLHNKNYSDLIWFKGMCARVGIFCGPVEGGERQNPFDENKTTTLYNVSIYSETLPSYFFMKESHKEKFSKKKIDDKYEWKVVSVEETERYEDVWCLQVADTESFTLECGIETKNCLYTAIDNPKVFGELLFALMNGCGVGFSVERQYINKLPDIPEELYPTDTVIVVPDSRIGWAKSLNELISLLYGGNIPKYDLSKLRPAGAILRTFGGRSSGPIPLKQLFDFVIEKFKAAKGQKLTSIDVHDVACMIGNIVVSGGVRRSSLISLSNLSDDRMRGAKIGQWWVTHPYRSMANNSAVYTDKCPDMGTFIAEWKSLYESKSGERGIFSRWAAKNVINRSNDFRKANFGDECRIRDTNYDFGINPCAEILIRSAQGCNLTEIIVRSEDDLDSLKEKIKIATILGTIQSTLTNFKFLSKQWKKNFEDERLLGVSMTGIMDNSLTSGSQGLEILKDALIELRKIAIQTNMEWAKKLGIPQSTSITSIKPSGTVSTLNDTASGIHPRHAPYYLRSVRNDKKDPVSQLLIDQGFYYEDDQMHPSNYVFYFPVKAPENAIFRKDLDAIRHLEIWKIYQLYYTEHKPSITVSVKEDEWLKVGSWVLDNFEWMSGVSFLPFSDHSYQQAPFADLNEDQYDEWMKKTPSTIDWNRLKDYEKDDTTTGSQELACSSGACELI